jgi:hypothetical protein
VFARSTANWPSPRWPSARLGPLVAGNDSSDTRLWCRCWPPGAWGHVEFNFQPTSWMAADLPWLPQPRCRCALFLGLTCASAFRAYLDRMLRHLDPSNSVPTRVRTAFDTLAEGLMVIDPEGNIVLANKAMAQVTGLDAEAMTGRSAGSPGLDRSSTPTPKGEPVLPWMLALQDGVLRSGHVMFLTDGEGKRRTFMVNCSPIPGAAGPAGVLGEHGRRDRAGGKGDRAARRARRRRGRQPRQERLPGQHEPRDPHPDERHPRLHRRCCGAPARRARPTRRSTWTSSTAAASTCSSSSTTSCDLEQGRGQAPGGRAHRAARCTRWCWTWRASWR